MAVLAILGSYQLTALLITIGAETVAMGWLCLLVVRLRQGWIKTLGATVLINLYVHPLFWLALHWVRPVGLPTLLGLEAAVVVLEAMLYGVLRGFGWRTALSVSALLNLFSYWVGVEVWMGMS